MNYDKWLHRFTTKMEKVIYRLTMIIVVTLFIVQAVLLNDYLQPYFGYGDRVEGKILLEDIQKVIAKNVRKENVVNIADWFIVLELVPPPSEKKPELYLLVNGKLYSHLNEGKLYLPVSPGDLLEVYGNVYGSAPAVVRIAEVYGKLAAPQAGKEIITFGERDLIAWIIPKD